jgi:MFS transporter, PPP family, 3-phenylpropionic acid transporter
VSIAYVFNVSCSNAAGGLIVQISSELDGVGSNINYGLARGIGSLFYAATSSILGVLLENASVQLLPYTAVVGLVCQFVLMLILSFQLKRSSKLKNRVSKAGDSNSTPPLQFFQDNKRFCIMMAGVTLMYLSHKLLLNFLIIVVRSVGGGTADMGHITSFMSIMEIPVMVFYDRIARRFTSVAAMQISAFFFVVKAAAFALSTNVAGLYVSSLFQPLSYAVLSVASVRYVHCYITHQDATKAQSMVFGATSVASVFAGSLGGVLYDMLSAKLVLLIGTCLATIGAIVCIISAKQGRDESVKQML